MALTGQDRVLLKRCLHREAGAWNEFVDRFLGLVYHVIQHTAHLRSYPLKPEDKEEIAGEILLQVVANDYAALRQFRGNSSLATYLTVIARRTCVQELVRRTAQPTNHHAGNLDELPDEATTRNPIETLDEVGKLLKKLPSRERAVVRLHYIEGRSYEEISAKLEIPINSVGAILSRARKKLRGDVKSPPPSVSPRRLDRGDK